MKNLICVAFVAALAVLVESAPGMDHPKFHKDMAESADACRASENPSDADLAAWKNHQVPTTQEGKCFTGCVFEKLGFIENGAYSRAKADEKANNGPPSKNPEMLAKILQGNMDCEKEIGSSTDKCETGPKLMICMEKLHRAM